jgi:Domain of unknown function (DUF4333)
MTSGHVNAAILAGSLALTACGSSGSPSPTIVNTEKVERAIEKSSRDQRKLDARVSCPSGVHQKQGVDFLCTATVGGRSTRFVVRQLDGDGRVHYEGR